MPTINPQLAAAKAHVASVKQMREANLPCPTDTKDLDELEAAIAEYESREVELSEDEMIVLKWSALGGTEAITASQSLHNRGFVQITSGSGIVCDILDAGRAYLERKPKIDLSKYKWGIFYDGEDFPQALILHSEKGYLRAAQREWPTLNLELREVQA